MYQVEDKEVREQFSVQHHDSFEYVPFINTKYVWAYTLEEAREKLINMGFELVEY